MGSTSFQVINWASEFKTGIPWQDSQNKELYKIMNNLYEEIHFGRGAIHAIKTLEYLDTFFPHHFALEEKYMSAKKYPKFEEHLDEHRKFVGKIERLNTSYEKSPLVTAMKLCCDLNDWFLYHIKKQDKELGLFIKADSTRKLSFDSKEGEGSTFTVMPPVHQEGER